MRNRGLVFIAILIILAGVLLLVDNLFDISLGTFCWPIGLILLGVFVLLRPRMVGPNTNSHVTLIGDLERSGAWVLTDEEYGSFIIDANYDLTKAEIPAGETVIRGYSFIGDVEIYAPADLALAIDAFSMVTEFKVDGEEAETNILSPVIWRSDGYKLAERRVRFELTQFIGDIKIRRF